MSKYVGLKIGKVHESHAISEYYCGRCGYPVTDHDSFCPECGGAFRECDASNLEAENAKLRELAHLVAEYTSAEQCEGCVIKRACNAGELDMCWIRKAIFEKLRELGMVD